MKIKNLRETLARAGCDVSDRMIKYYIEIGILPRPHHSSANQADYTRLHLIRLMKTAELKKMNTPFVRIKEAIEADNEAARLYAFEKGMTLAEVLASETYADREAAAFYRHFAQDVCAMSAEELLEKCGCERILFDLARDTGALADKPVYGKSELVAMLCIKHFFNEKGAALTTVEKISELSKLSNIASQLSYIYEKSESDRTLYETLISSMIDAKMKKE